MKEIFVGIFENDPKNQLNHLDNERNEINDLFLNHIDQFNAPLLYDAGIKGFMDNLEKLTNKMTMFHFSGHHNDKDNALKLSDEVFNNQGLIDILNTSPKLKMVFINGCSTDKIIQALDNVPIVIGTKTPVYDHFAKQLSVQFYNSLLNEKGSITNSTRIQELFIQAMGFPKGHYIDPDDKERGALAIDDLNKKVNNYSIHINTDADYFNQRVTYNADPDKFPLLERYTTLIDIIRNEEGLDEELYKYYPYFLCIPLEMLLNINDQHNSIHSGLSNDRYWLIRGTFKEFLNFLKFSAYSIIWSISKEHPTFKSQLTVDLKEVLIENLKNGWKANVQDKISEDLVYIYKHIPDEYIDKNPLWAELKTCVLENLSDFKGASDFFSKHIENNDDSKHDYLKAELYLQKFLKNFQFLRSLGIESVYDVFYNQFRYNDQRSYVINRSYYPVNKRPTSVGDQKSVIFEVTDDKSNLDINVHSVYICTSENQDGKFERVLNLSPFYLDVNSTSVAKNKIKLYYLDKYSESTNTLFYKEVINMKGHDDSEEENKQLGQEITVPLDKDGIIDLFRNGKRDIGEIEEKKKIRDHFKNIKELIS